MKIETSAKPRQKSTALACRMPSLRAQIRDRQIGRPTRRPANRGAPLAVAACLARALSFVAVRGRGQVLFRALCLRYARAGSRAGQERLKANQQCRVWAFEGAKNRPAEDHPVG